VKTNYNLKKPADHLLINIVNLKEVLRNLLDNAFKFTEEGSITLNYKLYKQHLYFSIYDTGVGIPEFKQKVIFESFIQSDLVFARYE